VRYLISYVNDALFSSKNVARKDSKRANQFSDNICKDKIELKPSC